jgi:hypothetical protein
MSTTTTESLSDSTLYTGASITVHVGRDTIDPQGLGSDDEVDACEEHILDAVRAAFPGAEVRAVGNGGRTSATMRDGEDFTAEVRTVVTQAFDSFEWTGDDAAGVLVSLDTSTTTTADIQREMLDESRAPVPAVETEATYSVTFRGAATVDAYSATEGADDNDALTLTETRERCEAYGVSAELRDSAGFVKGFVSADGSYTLA